MLEVLVSLRWRMLVSSHCGSAPATTIVPRVRNGRSQDRQSTSSALSSVFITVSNKQLICTPSSSRGPRKLIMAADTAVPQPDGASSVPKSFNIITDVQQWLQSQAAGTDPSTADAQLMQLRRAAADLRQCLQQHTLNVNSSGRQDFEECTAAVSSVQLLTQVLLAPPENMYSGLSGAPAQPEAGLALAGTFECLPYLLLSCCSLNLLAVDVSASYVAYLLTSMCAATGELHQQVAAAQLQLLMLLLMLFGHLDVPAPAADQQGGPSGPATAGDDTARNK